MASLESQIAELSTEIRGLRDQLDPLLAKLDEAMERTSRQDERIKALERWVERAGSRGWDLGKLGLSAIAGAIGALIMYLIQKLSNRL